MVALKHSSKAAVKLLEDGTIALADIEACGVAVDRKMLDVAIKETAFMMDFLKGQMEEDDVVYKALKRRYKGDVNIASREQLRPVLFQDLGYKPIKKTATGLDSVDKETLNHIDQPYVRALLKREELSKLSSTYLIALKRELCRHADGQWYVHPIYNLNTASTYRSSCQLINFQNQPVRNPDAARIIRSCYITPPGYLGAEVDFSGVEVKVSHAYNKDPNLLRYIMDPDTDMHRDQAARIFGITLEDLKKYASVYKKTVRDCSKNMFVFPQFYGSVYFQCAPDMWEALNDPARNFHIPGTEVPVCEVRKGVKVQTGTRCRTMREHLRKQGITELGDCDPGAENGKHTFVNRVREVEREMWEKDFPVCARWKKSWWQQYQETGGFRTHTGFYVNTHLKKNEVINFPIQGSAFHCLLWVLIQMTRWLRKNKMKSKVFGQIHDSMLMYLWPSEADEVLSRAKWLMSEALRDNWKWITTPMDTETECWDEGQSWADKKVWVPDHNDHWSAV